MEKKRDSIKFEEKYKGEKKRYKKLYEEKKRKENERWERKVKEMSREKEVWEIVNRERSGRRRVNEDIEMEEWKEHFMKLLGGEGSKVVKGEGGGKGGEEDKEKIGRVEIRRVIGKIKDGKAYGVDGIPGKVMEVLGGGEK